MRLLEPRAGALNGLRAGTPYRLEWFNPVTGVRQPASQLVTHTRGNAVVTPPEDEPHDWAAVIKKLVRARSLGDTWQRPEQMKAIEHQVQRIKAPHGRSNDSQALLLTLLPHAE